MKIAHIHVWDTKNKGDVAIVLAVQQLLREEFGDVTFMEFPIEVLKSYDEASLATINDCDLVVFGGGGVLYWYFLPFDERMIAGIIPPLAIFGVGYIQEIGQTVLNESQTQSLRTLYKKAAVASVRDDYTRDYLQKIGVSPPITVIGDPVILLKSQPLREVFEYPAFGINLNYSGWLGFGEHESVILESYQKLIDYLQPQGKVYYCLHHPDERKVFEKLERSDIEIIDLPPREQMAFYGNLNLMVGMMLHSCVMAFGVGTPEVNVGYDIRNQSFADFIGHPELVISADALTSELLLDQVKHVLKYQPKYRTAFANRKREIANSHAQFMATIKSFVR